MDWWVLICILLLSFVLMVFYIWFEILNSKNKKPDTPNVFSVKVYSSHNNWRIVIKYYRYGFGATRNKKTKTKYSEEEFKVCKENFEKELKEKLSFLRVNHYELIDNELFINKIIGEIEWKMG